MWYDVIYFVCNAFPHMKYKLAHCMDKVLLISRQKKIFLPELYEESILGFWVGYHPCAKQDVQQSIKNNILCFALTLNKVMLEWWWSNVAVFSHNASKDTNIHCIIITMSCHFLSLSLYHFSVSLLHCV